MNAMLRSISEDDFLRAGKDEAARTELIARLRTMKRLCTLNALLQFSFTALQAFVFLTYSPEAPREFLGVNLHFMAAIVGPICLLAAIVLFVGRSIYDGQIKTLILFDAIAQVKRN